MNLFPLDHNTGLKIPDDRKLIRERIEMLEKLMLSMPQAELTPPRHVQADGLYAREIMIPKGVMMTGKIHKREHLNFISKGEITVLTEDGVERIKAPAIIKSRPGTKRVGFAHEDTVWTTVHATNETDLEKIEQELVTMSYEDVQFLEDAIFTDEIKGAICPLE